MRPADLHGRRPVVYSILFRPVKAEALSAILNSRLLPVCDAATGSRPRAQDARPALCVRFHVRLGCLTSPTGRSTSRWLSFYYYYYRATALCHARRVARRRGNARYGPRRNIHLMIYSDDNTLKCYICGRREC
jgi:hypothetical protein